MKAATSSRNSYFNITFQRSRKKRKNILKTYLKSTAILSARNCKVDSDLSYVLRASLVIVNRGACARFSCSGGSKGLICGLFGRQERLNKSRLIWSTLMSFFNRPKYESETDSSRVTENMDCI